MPQGAAVNVAHGPVSHYVCALPHHAASERPWTTTLRGGYRRCSQPYTNVRRECGAKRFSRGGRSVGAAAAARESMSDGRTLHSGACW
jgi:hypothetical protein